MLCVSATAILLSLLLSRYSFADADLVITDTQVKRESGHEAQMGNIQAAKVSCCAV
jgi:hypothetical protein